MALTSTSRRDNQAMSNRVSGVDGRPLAAVIVADSDTGSSGPSPSPTRGVSRVTSGGSAATCRRHGRPSRGETTGEWTITGRLQGEAMCKESWGGYDRQGEGMFKISWAGYDRQGRGVGGGALKRQRWEGVTRARGWGVGRHARPSVLAPGGCRKPNTCQPHGWGKSGF